jgi:hypothetical protein
MELNNVGQANPRVSISAVDEVEEIERINFYSFIS